MDADVRTVQIEALKGNLSRYFRLLATELTDAERAFIHRRITEDRLALEALYAPAQREVPATVHHSFSANIPQTPWERLTTPLHVSRI
jgi:hypothetical protein